ncbi:hypothetical protein FS749_011966 [Ceratobasidium sp. UAMH 11750]|nr:hypothetical protein FS749_011966 [Ceratobasidium sp. UAMH 11750]
MGTTVASSTSSSYGKDLPVLHHTFPDSPAFRATRNSTSLPYQDGSDSGVYGMGSSGRHSVTPGRL